MQSAAFASGLCALVTAMATRTHLNHLVSSGGATLSSAGPTELDELTRLPCCSAAVDVALACAKEHSGDAAVVLEAVRALAKLGGTI